MYVQAQRMLNDVYSKTRFYKTLLKIQGLLKKVVKTVPVPQETVGETKNTLF